MTGATLLLRQIHPSFVQAGHPTSQAFRPTPKDMSKLSGYDGSRIAAEASFTHYTTTWKLASAGTMGLAVDECLAESLPTCLDPLPDCPEHAVVDFTGLSKGQCEKRSKNLQSKALARGWMHQAPAAN